MPFERMLHDAAFDKVAVKALSTVYYNVVNALCLTRYYPSPETIGAKIIRHARRGYDPIKVSEMVLRELRANQKASLNQGETKFWANINLPQTTHAMQ